MSYGAKMVPSRSDRILQHASSTPSPFRCWSRFCHGIGLTEHWFRKIHSGHVRVLGFPVYDVDVRTSRCMTDIPR